MTARERRERNRATRFAVAGVLVLFLLFAVLNAALQERIQSHVAQEIRAVTMEGNVGSR